VPSASPHLIRRLPCDRLAPGRLVAACCCLLLAAPLAGCTTTQEKAARHKAQAEHILKARAERQRDKQTADGPKTRLYDGKSAHRSEEGR
jgi:hypothetical protein